MTYIPPLGVTERVEKKKKKMTSARKSCTREKLESCFSVPVI